LILPAPELVPVIVDDLFSWLGLLNFQWGESQLCPATIFLLPFLSALPVGFGIGALALFALLFHLCLPLTLRLFAHSPPLTLALAVLARLFQNCNLNNMVGIVWTTVPSSCKEHHFSVQALMTILTKVVTRKAGC
jgi:hypothetical protein